MEIRLTVEIDGKKYGVFVDKAELVGSKYFGQVVEDTIDVHRGYEFLMPQLESVD